MKLLETTLKGQSCQLRQAEEKDAGLIQSLIAMLAEYEKLSHEAVATKDDLKSTLFGDRPAAEVIIAEYDGQTAGFALFFQNYSTFMGKPGMYLEDLFVKPELRGLGIGKLLLAYLAKLSVERGYGRFEWSVLDWNTPSIEFYNSLGAVPMEEWTVYRLTGNALTQCAESLDHVQNS